VTYTAGTEAEADQVLAAKLTNHKWDAYAILRMTTEREPGIYRQDFSVIKCEVEFVEEIEIPF